METMKVISVEGRRSKNGKMFYMVELEDGRKLSSFDGKFSSLTGSVISFDAVRNGDFLNIKLHSVVSSPEKASEVAIMANKPIEDKVSVNPLFVFLGACSLSAPLVHECLVSGGDIDTMKEKVKANFSIVYDLAYNLCESHMKLGEMKEIAKELF